MSESIHMSNPLDFKALQEAIDNLCAQVERLTEENKTLRIECEKTNHVRRLLVTKNQQLAAQVKQIIVELKGQMETEK